jgi:phosphoribosylformylglycinamidine cyclo-ligase
MAPSHSDDGGATYAGAGVDLAAADDTVERIARIAATTRRPGVVSGVGGFGSAFALDIAKYRRPLLVSSTDGVGTKLAVARALHRFDTVGLDLVAMCVDDLVCLGAEPLFFLDYIAAGRIDPDRLSELVEGIAAGCRLAGCALIGGETAEHPGVMAADDFDLAGFALGVVEHDARLGAHRVVVGDVLVALASPGLRSNGYSLTRKVLLEDARRPLEGPAWQGSERSLGEELLAPSVIYAPTVRHVLAAVAPSASGVHACAHITGGGIPGNVPRVLPSDCDAVVDQGSWPVPEIFTEVARVGRVEGDEMARVFNMGVGMVLVVAPSSVDAVRAAIGSQGVEAHVIGDVVEGAGTVRYR